MSELFKVIPPNLLRPLASPGAPVYARALFVLLAETRRHQQPLSRDLALSLVSEILYDPEALTVASEIEDEVDWPGKDETDEFDDEFALTIAQRRAVARSGALRLAARRNTKRFLAELHPARLRFPIARNSGTDRIERSAAVARPGLLDSR